MNLSRLDDILQPHPSYRRKQVYRAVFIELLESWDEVTTLPKELRAVLSSECPLEIRANLFQSENGETAKAAITLHDGDVVEAVLMRWRVGRNSVCVSSQVGCRLGCDFCLTGRMGFKRNLSALEIVSQVVYFARWLKKRNEKVSSVVFMGMGEPFLNYGEVLEAVRVLNHRDCFNLGARRISISTIGITEGIRKLASEPFQVNLAVSLHAPDDDLRKEMMPIAAEYTIKEILKATAWYIEKTRRRVMIEYVMLENVNDSLAQAKKLSLLLKSSLERLFFVNLLSYNQTGKYRPSPTEKVESFVRVLEEEGLPVTRRFSFGRDIRAACGQLSGEMTLKLPEDATGPDPKTDNSVMCPRNLNTTILML